MSVYVCKDKLAIKNDGSCAGVCNRIELDSEQASVLFMECAQSC